MNPCFLKKIRSLIRMLLRSDFKGINSNRVSLRASFFLFVGQMVLPFCGRTEPIPNFVAECEFSQKQFMKGNPVPTLQTHGEILFYRSNDWWKVEIKGLKF